ncbi:19335_t:CDS:2 [Entrophospora sp. SA101]|nr:2845_t:CDS:2 [Entrophospora sp. SA101]CAJ0752132.1 19335_t:CDS:2 [Entrophospora sp. SA101]CAJ0871010.1 6899_t:CDS:2 [Entrophospora sp. SA101]
MSNAQNYPQVLEFLRQCDLLEYYDRLISEGFDQMRSLFDITEMDLIAMNVKRGHRRRIQREIATMKGIPTSQPLHIQSEPGLGPIGDYSSSTTSASTNLSTSMTNPGKNLIPTIAAAPGSSIPVLIDGSNGGRSRESCARHQPPNLLPPLNHIQQSFYNNNNESSFQRQIALTLSKPSTMTINQPSRNIAATAGDTTAKFNSNNDQSSSSYPLPNKTNLNLTLKNPNDPNNNEDANNNNGKRKYKRHPKRDKNAPVKPLSAYVMFSHKVREEYQGKNISFPDMAKIVGDRWKSIPAEEKEMIENEAAKAKEEYLAAMTVYKTTDKWKQYQEYLRDFKEKHDPNCKLSSDRESNKGRKRSKFNVNSPDSDQTTNSGYSSTRNNKTTGSSTTTTSTFANISSNSNASTSISTNNSSTSLSPNINNTSLSEIPTTGFKVLPIEVSYHSNLNDKDSLISANHYCYFKQHESHTNNNKNDDNLPADKTLFITNLPVDATELHIKELFKECGIIKKVRIHKTAGSPAHIIFQSSDGLSKALNMVQKRRIWSAIDEKVKEKGEKHVPKLGLSKWIQEYYSLYTDPKDLQAKIDDFMLNFEKTEQKKRKELEERLNKPDEDGFITVTRVGKRSVNTDGKISVTAIKPEDVKNLKPKNKELDDFYRFQLRETKRNKLVELRKKFEEDKQKIAKLKESRGFKPY